MRGSVPPFPQVSSCCCADLSIETNQVYKNLINPIKLALFDLQLDAQNSYLFTYNIFIKILYMFRALPCSSSGGLRRNCIHAASGIAKYIQLRRRLPEDEQGNPRNM